MSENSEKMYMYWEKSTNEYRKKKGSQFIINNFSKFLNNFSALPLYKIHFLRNFLMVNIFQIFIPSESIQNSY